MSAKGLPISKLIEAIRQTSLHAVVSALDAGCDIEEADQHGQPGWPLRTACFFGNIEIVRELIRRGAKLDVAGSDGPGMPLRLALRRRNDDIVKLLLVSGAKVPADVNLPGAEPIAPPLDVPAMEFTQTAKESTIADFIPGYVAASASEPRDSQGSSESDINLNMEMLDFGQDTKPSTDDASFDNALPNEDRQGRDHKA